LKPFVQVLSIREGVRPSPSELLNVLFFPLLQKAVEPAASSPVRKHEADGLAVVHIAQIRLYGLDLIQPDGRASAANRQEELESVAKLFRDDPKLVEFAWRRRFFSGPIAGVEEFLRHFVKYVAGRAFDLTPAELLIPGFGWGEAVDHSGRVVTLGPAFEGDGQLLPSFISLRLNLLLEPSGAFST